MRFSIHRWILFLVTCVSFLGASGFAVDPSILYLSWVSDPATTMVVQWVSSKDEALLPLYYRPKEKKEENGWLVEEGRSRLIGKSEEKIQVVELSGLEPDTVYLFKIGKEGLSYSFRTMPGAKKRPLRFAVGGDAYFDLQTFEKMNGVVASQNPDFVVVGGDIAYTRRENLLVFNKKQEMNRWKTFFQTWKRQMVTEDGRIIPLLVLVGNHDVDGSKEKIENELFYQFFVFPEKDKAYRVLDFGQELSLIFLDSGHSYPVQGVQTAWLENVLKERGSISHKIPLYHVAAYPAVYPYNRATSRQIRKYWVPLFEQYGVKTVFEHHNHAYKVTYRLKNGKIDPEGILYLGDGSWGVPPRKIPNRKSRWYLDKAAKTNCFWMVCIDDDKCSFDSYNLKGELLDHIEEPTSSIFMKYP